MARLKEDNGSWRARSIMRRDARHDNEAVADLPSNGHKRHNGRKHVKHCEHDYERVYSGPYYSKSRCKHCNRSQYNFDRTGWRKRYRTVFARSLPNPHTRNEFFPIHEPGVCAVCDERRERNHEA